MANALNRHTSELLRSVDPSELPGDPADWILNPDMSAVAGVPKKYHRIVDDTVVALPMTERAEVDAAELLVAKQRRARALREEAHREISGHYSLPALLAAVAMYARAVWDGNAAEADQLDPMIDAAASIVILTDEATQRANDAPTLDELEAVQLDLTGLNVPTTDLPMVARGQRNRRGGT